MKTRFLSVSLLPLSLLPAYFPEEQQEPRAWSGFAVGAARLTDAERIAAAYLSPRSVRAVKGRFGVDHTYGGTKNKPLDRPDDRHR